MKKCMPFKDQIKMKVILMLHEQSATLKSIMADQKNMTLSVVDINFSVRDY